jgi:hypothetical protein
MKTSREKKRQDKKLKETFDKFNELYFSNEISPTTVVRFEKGLFNPKDKVPTDAHYAPVEMTITLDDIFRERDILMRIILLHEMAHAKLYQAGFVGWESDEGHGTTFQGEICRLIKIGAYDGLL